LFIPGYLMGSLTPAMSTAKDKQALVKIVQKSFHLLAAVGVILPVICYIVRKDIVLLVSSPEFISAASPFAILMLGTAFSYMTTVFTSASVALDKHRKLLYVSSATLALNIMINLITIPRFGIIGAAWATAITELFSLVAVYFLFRAQTGIFVNVATVIRPVIAALAVLAVVTTGERFLPQDPLLHAMTIGASAIGLYAVTLYVIGGMPEDVKRLIERRLHLLMNIQSRRQSSD
jgi:O-antigen/teichoic acid export membrane protein